MPTGITSGELALTHPVCYDVQGISLTGWVQHWRHSPQAPKWEALLGPVFWDMHHYCWALIHLLRASRPGLTKQDRDFQHVRAINDFYYVINQALDRGLKDFVMLPELYYRSGQSYIQTGDMGAALGEYDKAIAVKPDYWPAYLGKAEVFEKVGKRKDAREMLERGLQHAPGEPRLVAALAKLGGDSASTSPRPARPAAGASSAARPASAASR